MACRMVGLREKQLSQVKHWPARGFWVSNSEGELWCGSMLEHLPSGLRAGVPSLSLEKKRKGMTELHCTEGDAASSGLKE